MEIGDQVYKAVLDTGATLSIVARRLLKQGNIEKNKNRGHKGWGWSVHPFFFNCTATLLSGQGYSPQSE